MKLKSVGENLSGEYGIDNFSEQFYKKADFYNIVISLFLFSNNHSTFLKSLPT